MELYLQKAPRSPAPHGGILPAHAPRKPLLMRKTAGMRRLRAYASIFPPIFEYPKSPKCKAEITEWRFSMALNNVGYG